MRRRLLSHDFASSHRDHQPERAIIQPFQHGHRDALSGMLSADTNVLLPDDFLTKVDRASMGFGLEVRPPFIDWQVMELAASMPSEFKIRNGSKKWMLRQLFEARLPKDLVNRRKQGFEMPIDQWLRGPLSDQVRTHVLNPNGAISSFINTTTARQIFESHCQGAGRHGQLIWSLLILARWLDAWGKPNTNEGCMKRSTTHHPAGVETSI